MKFSTQNGPTLETYVDQIETTSLPRDIPDPAWTHRDRKGHLHGMIDGEYPTLKLKRKDWINEDGDEDTCTWYVCRRCKERTHPGTKPDPKSGFRSFIPGLQHFLIDGREVSKDEFDAAVALATPPASS